MALLKAATASGGSVPAIWTEGEAYIGLQPETATAVAEKAPASGGKCLAGSTLRKSGHEVTYAVEVPEDIEKAVLVFRYARLHIFDWKAAAIRIRLEKEGFRFDRLETFDQTGGWGANGPEEWGTKTVRAGTIPAGSYRMLLQAEGEHCDLNLDGFYLAGSALKLDLPELQQLDRVDLTGSGYWGIHIRNKAVDQDAFPDLQILARCWQGQPGAFTVELVPSGSGVAERVVQTGPIPAGDEPSRALIHGTVFKGIPDGQYTIETIRELDGKRLAIPVVAMGDLFRKATNKAESYAAYARKLELSTPELYHRVGADFLYATEYIQNTLILLRSNENQSGDSDDVRKRALAYMEKSKNRTVEDFATDLKLLISQFDETVRRIDSGDNRPYAGRSGDFRRAFFSDRTGNGVPYRVFVPDGAWKSDQNKFLLTLHGGGGDENYFPENDNGKFEETAHRLGYIFAAPRAVSRYRDGEEQDMRQLVRLIQQEYPAISPERTYCTGVSMGGYGTYHLATTFPGLFRAVAVVSSGGGRNLDNGKHLRNRELDNLAHTPILIMHGEIDAVVPVERALNLAKALEERGYVHELEIFPGHGHAYDGEMYLERTDRFFESLNH